jgi:membrane associated rhomboid family serine protease
MTIINEIKDSFRNGSILTRLIYINIGVFLVFRFIHLFIVLGGNPQDAIKPWLNFFSVPSDPSVLILMPWTPVSYMFLHFDFLHLLFNVLYLYWFGRIFMHLIGPRFLVRTYIFGGLAGVLLYILAMNLVPVFYTTFPSNVMMGASASVMAVLFALARFSPEYTLNLLFIGPVRLKYIALFAFLVNLLSIPALSNTGGILAHIGGALMGLWLGGSWAKKGTAYFTSRPQKASTFKWPFQKKSNMTVTHRRPLTDMEYNAMKLRHQKEVDRILEKIKKSGYDSLTESEKKTLFDASKEDS